MTGGLRCVRAPALRPLPVRGIRRRTLPGTGLKGPTALTTAIRRSTHGRREQEEEEGEEEEGEGATICVDCNLIRLVHIIMLMQVLRVQKDMVVVVVAAAVVAVMMDQVT